MRNSLDDLDGSHRAAVVAAYWEARHWLTHHWVKFSLEDEWEELGEVCVYDDLLVHIAGQPDEVVEHIILDVAAHRAGTLDLRGADKRQRGEGGGGGEAPPAKRARE